MLKYFAASFCGALCAITPVYAAMSESDAKQTVQAISQQFADNYNANKPGDVAALFLQDGVLVTLDGAMLSGRQDVAKGLSGRIQAGWTKETTRVISARSIGDEVVGVVEYKIAGSGPNEGKQAGGHAAVVLNQEGSGWRFKILVSNLKPVQE